MCTDWETIKWKEQITWSRWWHRLDGSFLHNVREHRVSWTVYMWACHTCTHTDTDTCTFSRHVTNSVLTDSENSLNSIKYGQTLTVWITVTNLKPIVQHIAFSVLFYYFCMCQNVPTDISISKITFNLFTGESTTPSQTHSQPAAMSYWMNWEPPPPRGATHGGGGDRGDMTPHFLG